MRAPSAGLMQPWRFIIVRDERTKAAMLAGHRTVLRIAQVLRVRITC